MKLAVGLGNPGGKYEGTRHNVGFRVIDELARRHGIEVSRGRFSGLAGGGLIAGRPVLLLKPGTFMNLSGRSVREALAFHKLSPADLLVVSDDLALPLGRLRLRKGGSAGGHNGLTSVIQELGTDQFPRLRIGIGQVPGERMVGHVLGPFSREEEEIIGPALVLAADAVECWFADGIEQAMNRFNKSEDPAG
ncbi:MAG: aminoacyl-tRNA hydrolase [Phycisphaerae bacterium]|jgi:PTH1 family peptidyl-tRNA hydrolase